MLNPDLLHARWPVLVPKLREAWPKLTEPDFHQVEGNLELLVVKVTDRYGIKRPDVLRQLEHILAA
jgi:uncharacterized protein YqjF (DUF2071 family)